MDLKSISKTIFAVICWAITIGLLIKLLNTFLVDKPTTSTKIEKNIEDTDIPEVVICLDPGYNNVTLAKHGYNVNSYWQGTMQINTRFVGWNGNSSDYNSDEILEEAMVFPTNETLVWGGFLEVISHKEKAEMTFRKHMYPYFRCLSIAISPNTTLRHVSRNVLYIRFNHDAFEKFKLSLHKIKVFVLDKVNSPKFYNDGMEMEGSEIEVHTTSQPIGHVYFTRILRSEHVQGDPLYDCAVYNSDNTYDDCLRKDMKKLFAEELGCQPPPFTDDRSQMCNQNFNLSHNKDEAIKTLFSQVVFQNRKVECKKPCTKNTYKTRYVATSPSNGNTEIFLKFDRTVYITKSGFSIDGTTLLTKAGGYIGFGRTLFWILVILLGAAQVLLLPSVKLKSDFHLSTLPNPGGEKNTKPCALEQLDNVAGQ